MTDAVTNGPEAGEVSSRLAQRGSDRRDDERLADLTDGLTKVLTTLRVNGEDHTVAAEPHHTLLEVLREEIGLTGTKHGCELGECGACTVLVDGVPLLSCLTLPAQVLGMEVTTVEGLADGPRLHPLQTAFAEEGAAQCGYCTPGMLMAAKALLDGNAKPTLEEMQQAIAGNLCRCTGYTAIYEAIGRAARAGEPLERMPGRKSLPAPEWPPRHAGDGPG